MSEEKPRAWLVIQDVESAQLEDVLNNYAEQGYHVFRLDQYTNIYGHEFYVVVLMNPILVGQIQQRLATAALIPKAGA